MSVFLLLNGEIDFEHTLARMCERGKTFTQTAWPCEQIYDRNWHRRAMLRKTLVSVRARLQGFFQIGKILIKRVTEFQPNDILKLFLWQRVEQDHAAVQTNQLGPLLNNRALFGDVFSLVHQFLPKA
jgi:hypothetical protein